MRATDVIAKVAQALGTTETLAIVRALEDDTWLAGIGITDRRHIHGAQRTIRASLLFDQELVRRPRLPEKLRQLLDVALPRDFEVSARIWGSGYVAYRPKRGTVRVGFAESGDAFTCSRSEFLQMLPK